MCNVELRSFTISYVVTIILTIATWDRVTSLCSLRGPIMCEFSIGSMAGTCNIYKTTSRVLFSMICSYLNTRHVVMSRIVLCYS